MAETASLRWTPRAEEKKKLYQVILSDNYSYGRIGGLRHAPPLAEAQHKWSQNTEENQ